MMTSFVNTAVTSESGHTLRLVLPANDDSARDECDGDDNSNNEHEQNSNTDDSSNSVKTFVHA